MEESSELKLSYNTIQYPFRNIISKIFNCENLESIHNQVNDTIELLEFTKDQSTIFHKLYYSSSHLPELLDLYHKFIYYEITKLYPEEKTIIYQAKPTFRISLPNNVAVGEWHTDGKYNHPPQEINFWLPFTKTFDSNSVWVESEPNKEDFHPFNCEYGEYYRFYANQCTHGCKINDTKQSRLSFDFRIILGSKWEESKEYRQNKTIKTGMSFELGSYYTSLTI